MQALIKII